MSEQDKCIQEAHRIEACDKYFSSRLFMPHTKTTEQCFEAGFDRGWQAAIASREPMTDQELEDSLPTGGGISQKDALRWMARWTELHHGILKA